MGSQHFRAGVGIVVRHPDGRQVLAVERASPRGAWQLPQGGLAEGEEPVEAAWRELAEETGLGPDDVELRSEVPGWLAYELPAAQRRRPNQRGQVQRWFVFDARRADLVPRLDGREVVAWRWVEPDWLIEHVPEFRRAVYAQVLGTG